MYGVIRLIILICVNERFLVVVYDLKSINYYLNMYICIVCLILL